MCTRLGQAAVEGRDVGTRLGQAAGVCRTLAAAAPAAAGRRLAARPRPSPAAPLRLVRPPVSQGGGRGSDPAPPGADTGSGSARGLGGLNVRARPGALWSGGAAPLALPGPRRLAGSQPCLGGQKIPEGHMIPRRGTCVFNVGPDSVFNVVRKERNHRRYCSSSFGATEGPRLKRSVQGDK
jgi:hypothetical protein